MTRREPTVSHAAVMSLRLFRLMAPSPSESARLRVLARLVGLRLAKIEGKLAAADVLEAAAGEIRNNIDLSNRAEEADGVARRPGAPSPQPRSR